MSSSILCRRRSTGIIFKQRFQSKFQEKKSSMMEVMDESSLEEELEEADKVDGILLPILN